MTWSRNLLIVLCCFLATATRPAEDEQGGDGGPALDVPLLDVGIRILDPGLAVVSREAGLGESGIYPSVRRSDAYRIAVDLVRTLEATGDWGRVHIVPEETSPLDLTVSGVVLGSTDSRLEVEIEAVDVAGRQRLRQRYAQRDEAWANEPRTGEGTEGDPYQALYDRVAADLAAAVAPLSARDLDRLRSTSLLRFASRLAPEVFGDYLRLDREGRVELRHLPANEDPLIAWVEEIRERDFAFLDLLRERYREFYDLLAEPYDHYRQSIHREDRVMLELSSELELRRHYDTLSPSSPHGFVSGSSTPHGDAYYRARLDRRRRVIGQLTAGFDGELKPLVDEIDQQSLRLRARMNYQVDEWRRLLEEMYEAETGQPLPPR